MAWTPTTWISLVSALAAVGAVAIMASQRGVDAKRAKALHAGLALLRAAAESYGAEVAVLRRKVESLEQTATTVAAEKLQIARQREARLEADRKWNAGMDLLDRLSG
jgi:uncharacterized protein YlxW (UPF0749 family)